MKKILLFVAMLTATAAQAQLPPVQPQALDFFAGKYEIEFRLKRADGTTAKLLKPAFQTLNGQFYNYTVSCWNSASACPEVTGATVRVYFNLWGTRWNVTNRTLCNATECQLPNFGPLVAKPGEAFKFRYDRVNAQWDPAPSVVSLTTPPPPPPPPATASQPGDRSPPLAQLVVNGSVWTLVSGQVLRNGENTKNPYSPSIQYIYVSGANTIRSHNNDSTYACWTGTVWAGSGC